MSSNDIAERYGVQYPAVNRMAKRLGLPPRRKGGPRGAKAARPANEKRAKAPPAGAEKPPGLRAIDVADMAAVDRPDPGPAPELVWLAVTDLVVDETYQRPLLSRNIRAIRKIAGAFDWARFQPIQAAPLGDGRYAVVDGQHRAHAAALAGIARIPASVCVLTPGRQAAAFAAVNTQRTNVTQLDLFRAALAAGDEWAILCARVVADAGCRLMTSNRSALNRKPREIYAVSLIRDHVNAGRPDVVRSGLSLLSGSPRGDTPFLYQAKVLKAWLGVLADDPGGRDRDLAGFLAAMDLVKLCTRTDHLRQQPGLERLSQYQLAMRNIREALQRFGDGAPAAKTPVSKVARTLSPPQAPPPAPPPAPNRPDWTPARDAKLIASEGKYASLAELADTWNMTLQAVTARWHLVRVAA